MKTVFGDISAIAHLFMTGKQDNARNSNNTFYFERNAIFSYGSHFCIANKVQSETGENAILLTERSYSNTTSKHVSVVRSAIYGNIIYCPYPLSKYGNKTNHEDNFKYWLSNCENIAQNLVSAKKPEKYLFEISCIKTKCEKYANFFGVAIPETLQAIFEISSKDSYLQFSEKKAIYEQKEKERKQAEQLKKQKVAIDKWLKFETYRIYDGLQFDLLRFNATSNEIETTQAVKIPFEIGKLFFRQLEQNKITVGMHLLSYSVRSIDKKTISIGCHTFEIKYLLKFGKQLYN